MMRIQGEPKVIGRGIQVRVDPLLVNNLIKTAGDAGFTASDNGKVDGTPFRYVAIEWKENPDWGAQKGLRKDIISFLNEWNKDSG